MANLQDTPATLAKIQGRMITEIDRLFDQLEAEDITIDEWVRKTAEVIAKGTGDAYKAGRGDNGRLTQPEAQTLTRFITEQLFFLSNFADDIRKNGILPAYRSRAQMYATATRQPFSAGDVVRQAGRPLPLPSMPAEGTICHTNCKCKWEIVTVNKKRGDFDAFWRLGTDDNCQTCVQRAQDWAPVQIREGLLL